jgi:hypothetical protein
MITDFLKLMFPVDLNPPPGVPDTVGCGVWGVGCRVWGVGCREMGRINKNNLLNPVS